MYFLFKCSGKKDDHEIHHSGGSRIFPGGGANPWGRRQDMILLNFPKKLHEIENKYVAMGAPP